MLSKRQVQERLEAGEIRIGYSFDVRDGTLTRSEPAQLVQPRNQDLFSTRLFDRSFFGDRFAIRLGPIVLSHVYKKVGGRKRFKNRPGVFDLRETGGSIWIMPGEGLTVSSIENIALGANTGAIILPRLSLATAGVMATTTYIDPCWDGILQLYIQNSTPHVYELKAGESVAVCRFYQANVSEPAEELRRLFASKSHHYGLNWENILDSDRDPQPLRKNPVRDIWYRRLRRFLTVFVREHWGYVVGASIFSMIVAFLIGLGAFYEKMKRIDDLEVANGKNEELAKSLKAELKQLQDKQVLMGDAEIMIPANSTSQSTEIPLERPYSPLLVALAAGTQADPVVNVRASVELDRQRPENAILRIVATRLGAETNGDSVRIRWIVGSQ